MGDGGDCGCGGLGVTAARQIVARLRKTEKEENDLMAKLERGCKKFDRSNRGALKVDDYFNVVRIQNGIEITKDEMKSILSHLPEDGDGRVKIDEFFKTEIKSAEAFKAIDRNADGYISKGELKLAKKNMGIKEIDECIKKMDLNKDGKLSQEEYEKAMAKSGKKK